MEDTKINLENVLALLNLVENPADTSDDSDNELIESSQSSPMTLRSAANKVVDESTSAFKKVVRMMIKAPKDDDDEQKSIPSVINCLVKVVSGMCRTISEQGRQIKAIMDQLTSDKTERTSWG